MDFDTLWRFPLSHTCCCCCWLLVAWTHPLTPTYTTHKQCTQSVWTHNASDWRWTIQSSKAARCHLLLLGWCFAGTVLPIFLDVLHFSSSWFFQLLVVTLFVIFSSFLDDYFFDSPHWEGETSNKQDSTLFTCFAIHDGDVDSLCNEIYISFPFGFLFFLAVHIGAFPAQNIKNKVTWLNISLMEWNFMLVNVPQNIMSHLNIPDCHRSIEFKSQ